MCNGVAFYDIL